MDYEKKYKEALERARCLYSQHSIEWCDKDIVTIFPELAVSEDEKIRKEIKVILANTDLSQFALDYTFADMIAWLEKQGTSYTKKDVDDAYVEGMAFAKDELDKQGEQKPADKVKPKFKVGDWVVYCGKTCKITGLHNGIFTITNQDGSYFFNQVESTMEPIFHLWTIQDAKNGDALCCGNEISLYKHDIKNCTKQETTFGGFVYHCCYDGKRFITDSLYSLTEQDKMDIHPATKEQRDLLFKKMKEAVYTFDFEKKELKKVEKKSQRMISAEAKEAMYDKPTDEDMKEALRTEYEKGRADAFAQMQKEWSEEDERMIANIRDDLFCYQTEVRDEDHQLAEDIEKEIKWLKSLKDRYTWKPSDAQIRALEYIINNAHNTSYSCKIAKELLEQLRRLKGE